ncbi:YncE family protein [Streptomyces sp. NPDC085540]|uniref:YncE family protein n=1 Tax=Streptomyces sp. NPDC085540 TaxID=3365730 RepID=UPI0037D267AB
MGIHDQHLRRDIAERATAAPASAARGRASGRRGAAGGVRPAGWVPVGRAAAVPPGTYVYVSNLNDDNVSVIDTVTNAATATIPVGDGPQGVAATPNGTRVYVVNSVSDNVSVIDTATDAVSATIPVGDFPVGVAVTPDGARVYVLNSVAGTVSVIDTTTNTVTATIATTNRPGEVAMAPDGAHVYAVNGTNDNVSVIDTVTNTVTATVPVGDFPLRAAVTTVGNIPVSGDPVPTELKLKTTKKQGKGSKPLTLTARLTAEGQPLQGETITFTTDGTTLCTSTTNTQGRATCTIRSRQAKHTCYTATFTGDDTYRGSTATTCLPSHDKKEEDKEPSGLRTAADALTPALSSPAGT